MKRLLLNFAFACSLFPLGAQQVLTLEECLQIGIENNLTLQSKRITLPFQLPTARHTVILTT